MTRHPGISFVLFVSLLSSALSQTPVKPPQQTPDDDVVRITTNLVQVDVTVTDKDGRPVTGLTPDDFEIREEGKLQQITDLSFIGAAAPKAVSPAEKPAKKGETRNAPAPPPIPLRAEQISRTVAVLVDDEFMSFPSVGLVGDSLKKFVAEQIEPNDLVGIFRTARSNTLLQQFTVDRKQLALAVQKLRWLPGQNNAVDIFASARGDDTETDLEKEGLVERASAEDISGMGRERAEYFDTFYIRRRLIVALRFLINDMRKLPGRKAIVIFSDGLGITPETQRPLRLLADYANRSGIIIHTIDARALVNPDFIGPGESPTEQQRDSLRQARAGVLFQSRGGLAYLAEQTGGLLTVDSNDIGKGLRRALEEQKGYYLIAYRPSEESFKGGVRQFRNLEVRVKREGLRVRTRKGFVGVTDDVLNVPERPRTGDSELYAALVAPIPSVDVPLRLTPITGQDAKGNSFLRVLLHIDGQNITFNEDANDWKRMTLDVAGVTIGSNGRVVNEFTRTHTVRVGPDTVPFVQQNGLIYSTDVPVKNPGAYQFRVVVRDVNSKKFGTAGQFLEIPDLRKRELTLSGIVLTEASEDGKADLPPGVPVEAALSPVQFSSNPAVRRFSPGAKLAYAHLIYNARTAGSTRKPQLTTQVRLFRDGKEVVAGPELVFDPGGQKTSDRLSNEGVVNLSPTAEPGDYSFQIVVKDNAAGKSPKVATQWIDFEVVE